MHDSSPDPSPLPLDPFHRRLGARWVFAEGHNVADHYGDPAAEYQALRHGRALIDRSWVDHLELAGEDRRRFLNGQVTCDVKELATGHGTYGFFTSAKGRVEADVVVLAGDDRLLLELPRGLAPSIAERLRKYVIVDRVEVHAAPPTVSLALAGPGAAEGLETLLGAGALPDTPWGHHPVTIAGLPVRLVRHPRLGVEAFVLELAAADSDTVAETLLASIPDLRPAGYQALATIRVEAGIPWFGHDFGPDNFPQETGIDEAVSYTKGCYLGQEVVARLHYRGQVSRQLRGLVVKGNVVPAAETEVLYEDRPAGTVTSSATSPELGRPVALALIQRRAFEPGTRVELAGGLEAEIRTLPLA